MGRLTDLILPRLGETMDEGTIGLLVKQPGERFKRGETLLEVESDKTTVEVPALVDGLLVEWLVASDDKVPVESIIARIEVDGEAMAPTAGKWAIASSSPSPLAGEGGVRGWTVQQADPPQPGVRSRASTAARAAARRTGVDLASLSGSGRNGRVMRADVLNRASPQRLSGFVETPHGKIFLREWPAPGAARGTALLLHGLFADSQSFVTLGRRLASEGLRTLAADLPGHGQSVAPATTPEAMAEAIAAALPDGITHIVGHSFGAVLAALLAKRRGQALQRLVLLAPAGTGEEINAAFLADMLAGRSEEAVAHLGEKLPPESLAALSQSLAANAAQLGAIAGHVAAEGRQKLSILLRLVELAVPVVAVYLRDDPVIPATHALNLPPTVAVHFLPGRSHLPHWRDPALVARLISKS